MTLSDGGAGGLKSSNGEHELTKIGDDGNNGKMFKAGNGANHDSEKTEKPLGYPKVVFFIIGNEFCERFTFYGMRTILSIFLKNSLGLEEDTATIIYHVFAMLCFFFPVLGAIIADSWLGKFRTIAYLSIVYAIGNIVISLASATSLGLPSRELTFLGLMLIAVGTGGIKPCVSSFGGEQFTVPQQARQLASFFSVFYFSINAGSLISTFLTPELRSTKCLDQDTCYPVAFGVPAVLMLVAIVIFFLGKPGYKIVEPKGNVMVEVSKCMTNAVCNKIRGRGEKKEHWLDYADAQYSQKLRDDIRSVLRVLLLFVPLPIFWALYDQQGSRWTFQANNMNGRIGSYVFKPDQMQVVNPVLILILLPLFDYVIYPALHKLHLLRKPLQRIAAGGMLAAVAFVISGVVQMQLDPDLPVDPAFGMAQVRVFSSVPCNVTLAYGGDKVTLEPMGFWAKTDIPADNTPFALDVEGECFQTESPLQLTVKEKSSVSNLIYMDNEASRVLRQAGPFDDDLIKDAVPKARILYHFDDTAEYTVKLTRDGSKIYDKTLTGTGEAPKPSQLEPGSYELFVNDEKCHDLFFDVGGAYNVLIDKTGSKVKGTISVVIAANVVSLFWQLPQYIIISMAEVMFSVTGLEFSFTQAPNSMKSVLSSAWLLTDAFGNVIIILIEAVKIFPRQSEEMFLFAGLMVAIMLIFVWLAVRYVPAPPPRTDEDSEQDRPESDSQTEKF